LEKKVTRFGTGAHVIVDKELIGKIMMLEVKEEQDVGQHDESRSSECEEKTEQA